MRSLTRSVFPPVLFTLLAIQGCTRAHPAVDPPQLAATDYIQLEYGGSKVQPQTIRVFADGRVFTDTSVAWDPDFAVGCPLRAEDQETSVPKQEADSLIYFANQAGFSKWDSLYKADPAVLDAGLSRITLRIGNDTHQVTDHAGSPPDAYGQVEDRISSIAPIPRYAQYRYESQERQQACQHISRNTLVQLHEKLFH